MCSPFFTRLANALRAEGHTVRSVSFNVGDVLYGRGRNTFYFGSQDKLSTFYRSCFLSHSTTDLVLFGDRRPVHQPAVKLAKHLGIRIHVFEEGYFRPYWVTLERNGVNDHSLLPRDPDWYREVGKYIPIYHNGEPFFQSFATRAFHDVIYHLGGALNPLCFPNYRTHAPYNAAMEYAGYIRRGLRLTLAKARDDAKVHDIMTSATAHFLLPLQLDSDVQIRDHSQFEDMSDVLQHVLSSFATHAPSDTRLVVKNHPLSPGIIDYQHVTRKLAARFGIGNRVVFLETGHMPTLLSRVAGVVTVNSTVGGSALCHNRPTFALSRPIYAMPGLTFQGSLEDFWQTPEGPDRKLFRYFRNTVIHSTQVNGGFYSRDGIDMTVRNALPILLSPQSRLEEFL